MTTTPLTTAALPLAVKVNAPDLAISLFTMNGRRDAITVGAASTIRVETTVTNLGDAPSTYELDYYRSTNRSSTNEEITISNTRNRSEGLGPRSGKELDQIRPISPNRPATYYYGVCIKVYPDPDNETNQSNNCTGPI